MRRFNFRAIPAVVVGLCLCAAVFAQATRNTTSVADTYLISAKAGGVNYVEGAVSIIRATGKSGVLLKRDRVEIGDRVTTGTDGRAEILLNPGSYIRLGKNSSFEFGSTDLEDLQITLDSGSAMFEVFADNEFRVSVFTPKGKVALIDTGIYRVDVATDGTALLAVTKGKAEVGEQSPTTVKDGRTGTVGSDTVAIAKFDKDKRDDLAEWSRTRSKELGKAASSLQNRDLNRSLVRGFNTGLWSLRSSFGLWVFNAQYGGYCFMPYGGGWRSPYGWWYDRGIYWNPQTYFPPTPTGSSKNKVRETGGGTGVTYNPNAKVRGGGDPVRPVDTVPPFAKVNRGGGDGGFFGNGSTNNGGSIRSNSKGSDPFGSGSSFPTNNFPSSSAPSAPSAPASNEKVRN